MQPGPERRHGDLRIGAMVRHPGRPGWWMIVDHDADWRRVTYVHRERVDRQGALKRRDTLSQVDFTRPQAPRADACVPAHPVLRAGAAMRIAVGRRVVRPGCGGTWLIVDHDEDRAWVTVAQRVPGIGAIEATVHASGLRDAIDAGRRDA